MSIEVGFDELRDQVAAGASYAFLITVNDDGRPHTVALGVEWDGDELVARPGRRTLSNAERRPEVSLLWPVSGRHGYALLVDGRAEVRAGADPAVVAITPDRAVLHKTPEGASDAPSCVTVMGR